MSLARPTPPSPNAPAGRVRAFLQSLAVVSCWLYLFGILALWVALWSSADAWWLSTVLLFGAHWLWASPLLVLTPAAFFLCPRQLWTLLLALFVLLFSVMGFNVPWGRLASISGAKPCLRVLTCNTHLDSLDVPALRRVIESARPDVVALQELGSLQRVALFGKTFREKGWHVLFDGELTLASRYPLRKIRDLIAPSAEGGGGHATAYLLSAPCGPIRYVNLHLASPHGSFDAFLSRGAAAADNVGANIAARREQSALVSSFALGGEIPVLLSGDFNTPPSSNIYRRYYSRFQDAFTSAGWGLGYTYHYGKRAQVRIDHILGGPGWRCVRAWIDDEVGSKHRPLIADMILDSAQ